AEYLGGNAAIALAIFGIIGPLTWYTIYYSEQHRNMLMATEFQNALFSAAARLKSKFCIIVKQEDGTVVYYDRDFQKCFPETANRGTLMLDKIFSARYISKAEADKLNNALMEGTSQTVFINMGAEGRDDRRVVVSIDPLPRPEGFSILRGRDYVVKQYERESAPTSTAPTGGNSLPIAHMMHMLPYGIYVTDADGKITFMNYRLETWRGFEQGEVQEKGLTLQDIVPQRGNAAELQEVLLFKDWAGNAKCLNKHNEWVDIYLQQEITKDAHGAIIGSVSLVQPASQS
ncbi:MAG: hypothetical protein ACPG80_05265, partial [Rickettsiales bacterium]